MMSLVLICLAALCDAVRDTCSHHFSTSRFRNDSRPGWNQWWDASISWRNKYVDGDPARGTLPYPVFITDAWHCFKSLIVVLLIASIVLYQNMIHPAVDFVIFGFAWNLVFSLFYNEIFKK